MKKEGQAVKKLFEARKERLNYSREIKNTSRQLRYQKELKDASDEKQGLLRQQKRVADRIVRLEQSNKARELAGQHKKSKALGYFESRHLKITEREKKKLEIADKRIEGQEAKENLETLKKVVDPSSGTKERIASFEEALELIPSQIEKLNKEVSIIDIERERAKLDLRQSRL